MQQKSGSPKTPVKNFIVYPAADIAVADCIVVETVDCIVEIDRIAVAVDCIAGIDRIVVAADCIVENNLSRIEHKIVGRPADSFEVWPVAKFAARFPGRLELVGRLGKCWSRELSVGRKLDWRSDPRPLEVVLRFAACAP